MKEILITALTITLISAPTSSAQECVKKACIEVYTQDGHIVIEGRKGKGAPSTATKAAQPPKKSATAKPSAKPTTKPSVKVSVKATPIPPVTPPVKKSGQSAPSKKASSKPSAKPSAKPSLKVTRQPVVKESGASESSLYDKLVESLPTAGISYQPSFSPLVKTPVYFWSDIPTLVTKKVEIVGELVEVKLRPTFIWHYGDGVIYLTRNVGAPYPDGQIQHTYSKPGHYLIELITRWDGEFTIDGISTRIPGEITTVSVLPITVVTAPIRFMN
jgi:hypothetical protein